MIKTTHASVNKVVSVLKDGEGKLSEPVWKYIKPTKQENDKYVVVNSLPIAGRKMQNCLVNVNYYVKDLSAGIPDVESLEAGTEAVINLLDGFEEFTEDFNIHIDIDESNTQDVIREEKRNEHYSNMRFIVKFINKT